MASANLLGKAALAAAALVALIALVLGVPIELYRKAWPPSSESAPFLLACFLATAIVAFASFRASAQSKEANRAMEKKRALTVAQLSQAIKWNDDDEDKDEDKEKEKKENKEEGEDKKHARGDSNRRPSR